MIGAIMNKKEQINFFKGLPKDTDPLFTSTITEQIDKKVFDEEILEDIIKNETEDKIKFGAYYTLTTIYRVQKNYSKIEKLAKDYKDKFSEKPLFVYMQSFVHKRKLTKTDADLSIQYARDAIAKIEKENSRYPGFYQNFADAVLLALENQLITDKKGKLIDEASVCINKALQINPNYAKYYATLGRTQLQKKEYDEAKKNLNKAIDLEDSKSRNYSLKITEYENILTRCFLAETTNEVERNRKKIEQEYTKIRNSAVEFIGFFTAIVALVISTATIVVQFKVADGIRIIGFLYGGMIIALACLKISLDINKLPVLVAGILLVIAVVFVILSFCLAKHM